MCKKVLITGGSGLIGTALTKLLLQNGYNVEHIGRSQNSKAGVKTWVLNAQSGIVQHGFLNGLNNQDFVLIHLAGEGIADKKWTEERKQRIINSRVDGLNTLYALFEARGVWPQQVITAGGIGYYGMQTTAHIYTETDEPGNDFLAKCCIAWERAAHRFAPYAKVTVMRTPLVLDKNQGGLAKMAQPVKFGFTSAYASGKQWVPWVHLQDLCQAYLFVMQQKTEGILNICAPMHVTNRDFMKMLAKQMKIPFLWPAIPKVVLKTFLGEMSGLITEGSRVEGNLLITKGFSYQYKDLKLAIEQIYS